MKFPRFSIIIPSYNRAALIVETLNSVSAQTFQNWECIVVDDGSTDNTKEVIETLAHQDPRIRYIYQKNAERSAARNNGIRNANGEWVLFLDSDDLYESNYLSELNSFISRNTINPSLIICNFSLLIDGIKHIFPTPDLNQDGIADWLFEHPVSPSRACVHKDVLKKFQFDLSICIVEDTVLWVTIATTFPVFHLNKTLVSYRVHENNSVSAFSGSAFKRYAGLKVFFAEQNSQNVSLRIKKKMLSETEFRIAEYFRFNNRYFLAFYYSMKSLFSQWNHEQRKMRMFFILNLIPIFRPIWKIIKS